MKNVLRRASALLLAVLLIVPAYAEDTSAEGRKQDLEFLYEEVLKKHHPDVFANSSEEEFTALKTEIESRLETESETEFLMDLMRLTALVGDSHTMVSLGGNADLRAYPYSAAQQGDSWMLSMAPAKDKALLGQEIVSLAGKPLPEAMEALAPLFSSDNPVHLRRQIRQACNIADIYEYMGLVEKDAPLEIGLKNGKTLSLEPASMADFGNIELSRLSDQIKNFAKTAAQDASYLSMPLDENTYYIQYNVCIEDEKLSMEDFAAGVAKDLDAGSYQRIVLDLRNNGGGSDGLIWPVLTLARAAMDNGAELVGLIGERTFSSALINAVEIQEMGGVLAGEAAGGSVCHFGAVQSLQLPNTKMRGQISSKFIDTNTLLDAGAGRGVEALEPDIEIPQTLDDTLNGKDTAIEWLLAHPEKLEQKAYPDAPLTRGRFVGQLYQALGSPDVSQDTPPFPDCFGIEWYLQPLTWAYQEGVAKGCADGKFYAARPVTWGEAAAFLTRAAEALDLEANPDHRSGPIPQALVSVSSPAVTTAWELGVLPSDADPAKPITRAQGEAMAEALAALQK